ncbi:MAG: hypothetical protein J6Y25_02400 [Elusimicrobiaceae bacterium]|nr:hypothetical protein [Elusimicrobiaceae bacterium]MBP5616747.1 hypothetical protein [Elusimicrobiaceae bacterium]
MLKNKRGVALLQVLVVAALLAGMAAMILRVSLSRTIVARQNRKTITAQMLIESCMAQVNAVWADKLPEEYARDLGACQMCQSEGNTANCPAALPAGDNTAISKNAYRCQIPYPQDSTQPYRVVTAQMTSVPKEIETYNWATAPCKITYSIENGVNL